MTSQQDVPRRLSEIAQAHRDSPELKKYPSRMMRLLGPLTCAQVLIHVEDDQLRQEGVEAVDCFYRLAVLPSFNAADLAPIQHIANSSNRRLREIGVQLLLVLGVHHASAQETLYGLLSASRVAIRYTMITFFANPAFPHFQPEFVHQVIAKGLEDVTPKVRRFAAVAAHSFGIQQTYRNSIRENVRVLIDRLLREEDDTVKREILFTVLRVGQGYDLCETTKDSLVLIHGRDDGSYELLCPIGLSRPIVQSLVEAAKGWGATIAAVPATIMMVWR